MTESPPPSPAAASQADMLSEQGVHDARLQAFWKQALASAPATGLSPERLAALRQRVLADAAHALTAPGPVQPAVLPPSAWLRLRHTLQKLMQPQWTASLASVCIACLILVIWHGRWPEAALEDSRLAHQAPPANSAPAPVQTTDQRSAAREPQIPPQPEPLPAPAHAPSAPASTAATQSEDAMQAQPAQTEAIMADAITANTQPHRQRDAFSAPMETAALAQPLAQATHWRWAGANGQDQAATTTLSETARAALQQILLITQPLAAPASAPEQAQRMLLLHEQQVLLQLWIAPGHIQWQQAAGDGLIWLAQPSAHAYNQLMRALATDASQPKSQ